ncbi:unnamed protein product [Rotaria sordida]|uniref:G-protein coupled receptors family 1 profile domain-containing protein n=1 Tax=Rotaria sordida TaxID=392033 RepID=A0A819CSP3_9BILA|nr:unnamed protein product [Rotaria sordida]CAF1252737.1 unnamed protein product [Rotaria sordida]CAF1521842.1 unnamed protein product [Rotaria sordida]CAF3824469.1 unnamed protein product [Rotaria sordida]
MWTTAEFVLFQKQLFNILVPIIIIIGNFGSILNVIVFSISKKLRSSPCSLYLIFASIGFALYLNIVALLRLLQIGFNIDPSSKWSWVCKIRFYAVGFLLMLPRSYMLLAAIDRYLMSISSQHRFLSHRIALKMILLTCLFWMIICVHNIIYYDIQISLNGTNPICSNPSGTYSTFLSFYSILINGLSMPLLMTIFTLLTLRNLKHYRNQIHNNSLIIILQRRKKQEWSILRMILVQLIVNVILSLPITIYLCYNGLTQYIQKSSIRIFIENYIYNMLTILQYLNAAASFYVYSLTSHIFRKELYYLVAYYSNKLKQYVINYSTALFTQMTLTFTT